MDTLRRINVKLIAILFLPVSILRQGVLRELSSLEILLGGFGLIAALVAGALLSPALGALPGAAGDFAPVGVTVLLAPVGIGVALGRRVEVERWIASIRERTSNVAGAISPPGPIASNASAAVVVDTSTIIDGRLADVVDSGFLLADLIVPRFVLDELRRVAGSSDRLRRQRGRRSRRGLELLARIQASDRVHTIVDDTIFPELSDVDAQVLALAQARSAAVLTNDFNLTRQAELQQLRVLNINVLAQAIRTNAVPGESFTVEIHQEGRERNQGVGFLDDGTMIVVEDAKHLVGEAMRVEITRVIQTSAGRMLFARQQTPQPTASLDTAMPSEAQR